MSSLLSFERGMDYGAGFDRLRHQVLGDSVARSAPEAVLGGDGATIEFRLEQVTSHEQLTKSLNISASASLGNAVIGGGSLKADFADEHSVDEFSLNLLVHVVVVNAHKKMRDVRLNRDAWDLLDQRGPDAFRVRYGDEFVVGITTGGEYFGLIDFHTRTEEHKQELQVSIQASGGLGSWSAAADFKSKMQEMRTSAEYKIYNLQIGGVDRVQPTTIEEMIPKAVNFATTVQNVGVPFTAELSAYSSIPLPAGKNPLDIEHQRDVLRDMAEMRSSVLDLLASVDYARNPLHRDEFDDLTDLVVADLNSQADQLRQLRNKIHQQASACFNNFRECSGLTDFSLPNVRMPKRKAGLPPKKEPQPAVVLPAEGGGGLRFLTTWQGQHARNLERVSTFQARVGR